MAPVTGLSATHVDNAIKALTALKYALQNPSESTLGRFAKKRVIGTKLSDDKKALIVPLSGVFGIQAAELGDVTFALTDRTEKEPDADFSESEGDDSEEPSSGTAAGAEATSSDAEDGAGDKSDKEPESDDKSDDEHEEPEAKKSTPISEARGVFQSRQVTDLILAAGPHLQTLNRELNDLVVTHRVGRKRRRTAPHDMPADDDVSGAARQQAARVAQQAAGAIWSLVRANVGKKGKGHEGEVLLSIANQLRDDPRTLFTLKPVEEVFKKVLGGDPAAIIRACATCRTVGCLACRRTAIMTAPDAPPASSDERDSM
jgi:hypothetical protein